MKKLFLLLMLLMHQYAYSYDATCVEYRFPNTNINGYFSADLYWDIRNDIQYIVNGAGVAQESNVPKDKLRNYIFRTNTQCVRQIDTFSKDLLPEFEKLKSVIKESDALYKEKTKELSARIVSLQTIQMDLVQNRINSIAELLANNSEINTKSIQTEISDLRKLLEAIKSSR